MLINFIENSEIIISVNQKLNKAHHSNNRGLPLLQLNFTDL
ncbi:hypothetical protein ACFFU1_10530 [Algibacter miyuki]|uniref:Uncharacterized protein n=1 Tax=Algibacter miyuki TaxID=1306933 RepID=A0ABV5H0Y1_9FLAO|nr:hypothetical protein [Algibacter miyuki]MDN3667421.1 hypothetical protein [Algibacter miyuki]